MPRASSKTISLAIQSATTGESRVLIQRPYVSSTRTGGRYLTSSKQFALFDVNGRHYDRVSDNIVTCHATGERFHVVGSADSIRKAG